MGQADIIELLKKKGRALSRTEIAKELEQAPTSVSATINKMLQWGDIVFEELDRFQSREYGSKCNRRMRLYKLP